MMIPIFIPKPPEEKNVVYVCANHKTSSFNKFINCPDHSLCRSCEFISIKMNYCIICYRILTPEEISNKSTIKNLCFRCDTPCLGKKSFCECRFCEDCKNTVIELDNCPICDGKNKKIFCDLCHNRVDVTNKKRVNLECNHNFCHECFENHLLLFVFERRTDIQLNNGIPCLLCNSVINDVFIQKCLGEDFFKQYLLIKDCKLDCLNCNSICTEQEGFLLCTECNKRFCKKCFFPYDSCSCPSLSQEESSCKVCLRASSREYMKTLDCNHFFCYNCLTDYIILKIKENPREIRKTKEITCLECDQPISIHIIKSLLNEKNFNKFSVLQLEFNECPKCDLPYVSDDKNVFCIQCFYEFCNTCLRSVQDCSCENKEEIEYEGLSSCPGCRTLYEKDKNCFNVKCLREDCLAEFCFMCSAFKGPISAHGCHYHRPQCKFFSEFKGEDTGFKESCSACVKAGKLCEPPKNLKEMRKFEENEV